MIDRILTFLLGALVTLMGILFSLSTNGDTWFIVAICIIYIGVFMMIVPILAHESDEVEE